MPNKKTDHTNIDHFLITHRISAIAHFIADQLPYQLLSYHLKYKKKQFVMLQRNHKLLSDSKHTDCDKAPTLL